MNERSSRRRSSVLGPGMLVLVALASTLLAQGRGPAPVADRQTAAAAAPLPRRIFLTRHAHRDPSSFPAFSDQDINQSLSVQGKAQARHLADVLRTNGISAIYVTQFVRTRQTSEPLTEIIHVTAKALPMPKGILSDPDAHSAYITESLATILGESPPGNVLIIGHDLTIPAFLKQLLPESSPVSISGFGDLFIVEHGSPGRPASITY